MDIAEDCWTNLQPTSPQGNFTMKATFQQLHGELANPRGSQDIFQLQSWPWTQIGTFLGVTRPALYTTLVAKTDNTL